MLQIEALDFGFDDHLVFKGLNLTVEAGDHIVIVGDSGGGKSTLLELVAAARHSAIRLEPDVTSSMVLQEGALLDHLTVMQNLRLVARYLSNGVNESAIVTALKDLNIDSSLHSANPAQLSGGQKRRVAISRALLASPSLMLFDEPDAGLDIANLNSLAEAVNSLSSDIQRASITVSHNPYYISRIATKVYRLTNGQLRLLFEWPETPTDNQENLDRQNALQNELARRPEDIEPRGARTVSRDWVFLHWMTGVAKTLATLVQWPKSVRDEFSIAAYGLYISFITGLVFYALVGFMLGSTTIAVVRMLADNALTGLVSWFVKPETLIDMMGGRYVLYLAPAIGAMLFSARSGSIVANWLGQMVRGRQVQALSVLGVPPDQYLRRPSFIALMLAMNMTIVWFSVCVWLGGVLATDHLFSVPNAVDSMVISSYDIVRSLFWPKTLVYSALVALTVTSLGLAPKVTGHQVNVHTTKTIIYSTLSIALAELLIVLV